MDTFPALDLLFKPAISQFIRHPSSCLYFIKGLQGAAVSGDRIVSHLATEAELFGV